jgi:HSP20 family protein
MASFFEKLRSSMGVEEEEEKKEEKKEQSQPKSKKKEPLAKEHDKEKAKKVQVKSSEKEEEIISKKEDEDESDWFEPEGELAVDVYQTDKDIIIQSTIAGVKPEDLDISVENDTVTISGERKNVIEEKEKNYFYQECFWGAFSRQIILPEEVDGSRAEASMKDGVFTLRLPKIERQKVRKVKVQG